MWFYKELKVSKQGFIEYKLFCKFQGLFGRVFWVMLIGVFDIRVGEKMCVILFKMCSFVLDIACQTGH